MKEKRKEKINNTSQPIFNEERRSIFNFFLLFFRCFVFFFCNFKTKNIIDFICFIYISYDLKYVI